MRLSQTGGCQCGKLRYEITEAPRLVYSCHCTDCQKMTSSAFSMGLVVAEEAFHLTGGRAPLGSARSRQWPHDYSLGLPGLWVMADWHSENGWGAPHGARWHFGRHLMVGCDCAFLDPQQAALDHAA